MFTFHQFTVHQRNAHKYIPTHTRYRDATRKKTNKIICSIRRQRKGDTIWDDRPNPTQLYKVMEMPARLSRLFPARPHGSTQGGNGGLVQFWTHTTSKEVTPTKNHQISHKNRQGYFYDVASGVHRIHTLAQRVYFHCGVFVRCLLCHHCRVNMQAFESRWFIPSEMIYFKDVHKNLIFKFAPRENKQQMNEKILRVRISSTRSILRLIPRETSKYLKLWKQQPSRIMATNKPGCFTQHVGRKPRHPAEMLWLVAGHGKISHGPARLIRVSRRSTP